jgi:phage terminase Nu1 subunit (DNA packaging protein)
MPTMLRVPGKATQIAFKLLGVPLNMQKQYKTKEQRKIEQRLVFEETIRVR